MPETSLGIILQELFVYFVFGDSLTGLNFTKWARLADQ